MGLKRNYSVFDAISNLDQQPGPSQITSDPYGVCFCNSSTNKSLCLEKNPTIHIYPGASFLVSASAVGQMNGVVPSRIEVRNANPNDNVSSIDPKFNSGSGEQPVVCHVIHISVFTTQPVVTLQLMVEQVNPAVESGASSATQITIPEITVFLNKCPWIFEINKDRCECAELLKSNGIQCDINTVSFHRSHPNKWVGCELKNNSLNTTDYDSEAGDPLPPCDKVLYGDHCLHEYCSNVTANLTPLNSSAQCKEGRELILCGACKEHHSLTLGPPQCVRNEDCAYWKFVVLLLVSLCAGALLVFFLTLFNITVSEGTVNGLLFYANFVHANRTLFFTETPVDDVVRIFIAWLNLDFGFEVCFYAGMDAYQKIWWEFGFLLYLLLLGLLIIYSSHKFVRVTRLVGRNVVSVLSTIMLFSYSKLVSTSVKALEFTYLQISDYSQTQKMIPVWRHDGNVDYFQGKHIPLAILAIFLCTIAFLYTLSLLFIQCLQRRSNWRILRWVNKLRPFFDANTGPCRDHYRFWPGFLLFTRFGLFFMYSVVPGPHPENKLYFLLAFCVFIFISACISPHGVYKKWPLNILEFSFFLNLGILSALVVVTLKSVQPTAFTFPSVGIAAITFGCILVFHSYKRVSRTRKWRIVVAWIHSVRQQRSNIQASNNSSVIYSETGEREANECTPILGQRIHHVVGFNQNQLRESLLAED